MKTMDSAGEDRSGNDGGAGYPGSGEFVDDPPRPARPLGLPRLLAIQAGFVAAMAGFSLASGLGSPTGILAGAGVFASSFVLQALATRFALSANRRPALAVGLFTAKLALLVGLAAWCLAGPGLDPMSFAAGATTLLLAIVLDACYPARSSRGLRRRD